jgi:uncharacterized protein with ParB-like and HNH nuclease domain
MEAKESKILDIFTENKKYYIPQYQRPYCWTVDNAHQLISDIYQSCLDGDQEYFIGSLICILKKDSSYEVVDGQQRLTTLTLILNNLKKLIRNEKIYNDLENRLMIVDAYSEHNSEPRLKIRIKESSLYNHYILLGQQNYKPTSLTTIERTFVENNDVIHEFLEVLDQETLAKLAKFILHKVYLVFVQTDDFSSAFRLFNVLNNRGLPLSSADLLKNSLFEAAQEKGCSEEIIQEYWDELEDLIDISGMDKFLSIHKISKKVDRDRVLIKDLSAYLTSLVEDYDNNPINFLNDLLKSARNYKKIKEADFPHRIQIKILTLIELKTDEWLPLFLAFLNRVGHKRDLDLDGFDKLVTAFEKVYMQSRVCNVIKSRREMPIYSGLVAINTMKNIDEILASIYSYANNEEFLIHLDSPIYEPRPNQVNLVKALLLRLDRASQDQSVIKTYNGSISIEHILPQKLSNSYWTERFDFETHQNSLHKLGNLTLISGSKNSQAQNFDFNKKKDVYHKLNNKVSFDITRDLIELEDWDVESFKSRQGRIVNFFKDLWLV